MGEMGSGTFGLGTARRGVGLDDASTGGMNGDVKSLLIRMGIVGWVGWFCAGLVTGMPGEGEAGGGAGEALLFTSFRGNGEDGLHLLWSTNGHHWAALRGDRSFLRPEVGGYRLMRDPCIAQGPDGTFHMVWTTAWTTDRGAEIGYACSRDLVHWSPQRALPLMAHEPATRNLWAPELFYDRRKGRWLVFWSSTIPGRFPETDDTGDDGYNHRIYYATTRDFVRFSPTRLFFDPGFNVIDATLVEVPGGYMLVFKDERLRPLQKRLRVAFSTDPEGPFGPVSDPISVDWAEGPSAIRLGSEYLIYYDRYSRRRYYGALRSVDLRRWEDISGDMRFPPGHKHGTVFRVPEGLLRTLLSLE